MNLIVRPLKHCSERKAPPDAIILHYNSLINVNPKDPYNCEGIINLLDSLKLSYHYLISRDDDKVYLLVPPKKCAWHAGHGTLHGNPVNPNQYSIGVCFAAKYKDTFTASQLALGVELVKSLRVKYPIPLNRIVGHDMVDAGRKIDPGPTFPWKEFLDKCAVI